MSRVAEFSGRADQHSLARVKAARQLASGRCGSGPGRSWPRARRRSARRWPATASVTELFVTAAARPRHAELAAAPAARASPVHAVSGEVMAELAQTVTPQGMLAVCRFVDVPLRRR